MIIAEIDLLNYPQTYFPFILFDYATRFKKDAEELTFFERDSKIEKIEGLRSWVEYFQNVKEEQLTKDVYNMKFFAQALLLLPVVYLQANNTHIYKKFSFDKAKQDFNPEVWHIIEKASQMRSKWRWTHTSNRIWNRATKNQIRTHIAENLGDSFLSDARRLVSCMWDKVSNGDNKW